MMSNQLTYGQYSTSVAQLQIKLGYFCLFLHSPVCVQTDSLPVCVGICGHVDIT